MGFYCRFVSGVVPALRVGLALSLFASTLKAESLTLQSYYPSPIGSYSTLTTAGNTYLATTEPVATPGSSRVGIGTISPVARLHIADTTPSGIPGIYLQNFGRNQGDITWEWNHELNVGTWNTITNSFSQLMIITTPGSVGLGVQTPQSRLDVLGNVTIGASYAGVNPAPANGLIVQGNVGIGTNNPTERLHVVGNAIVTGTASIRYQQRNRNNSSVGSTSSLSVSCTGIGERVIGGGCRCAVGSPPPSITQSYPLNSIDWQCTLSANCAAPNFIAYAICARIQN